MHPVPFVCQVHLTKLSKPGPPPARIPHLFANQEFECELLYLAVLLAAIHRSVVSSQHAERFPPISTSCS